MKLIIDIIVWLGVLINLYMWAGVFRKMVDNGDGPLVIILGAFMLLSCFLTAIQVLND